MNVQLSYGCSGSSGFGPQSNNLLDRITLPDGSFYKFTYEPTTTGSGNVTGRIASVSSRWEGLSAITIWEATPTVESSVLMGARQV
jgi:hypothetical protein